MEGGGENESKNRNETLNLEEKKKEREGKGNSCIGIMLQRFRLHLVSRKGGEGGGEGFRFLEVEFD